MAQPKAPRSWIQEVQVLLQVSVLLEEGKYQLQVPMYRGPKGLINLHLLLYKAGNIRQVIPSQEV